MINSKRTLSFLFFIAVILVATGFLFLSETSADKTNKQTNPEKYNSTDNQPKSKKKPTVKKAKKYTIKEGDTFEKVAKKLDIKRRDMLSIVSSSKPIHSLTDLSVGQPLYVLKKEGNFIGVEYEVNSENKIITTKTEKSGDFETKQKPIEYKVVTSTIKGTISSSLFKAGKKAGMSDELILDFAEIFAWSVDFAVEVKSGDKFKLIYERRFRKEEKVGPGDILAARVTNQGKNFNAFMFENKEGEKRYYNEEGESLRKQFLKAPLRYDRISSGFTNARFHPTLGQGMPHRAIDYAASRGTPIRAVGDGTVTYAGWKDGYGYYINIRHNGTFQTQYAHLSSFADGIRSGTKVDQGDIIGFVGSTGFSTGPHLHYQIKKYGRKVNPLEVELPKGEPVPDSKKQEFNKVKTKYIDKLKL